MKLASYELELRSLRYAKQGDGNAEWIREHQFRAWAWRLAMKAHFQSVGNLSQAKLAKLKADIDAILGPYDRPIYYSASDPVEHENKDLPTCRGEFDMKPPMRYNGRAAATGMHGAVIMRIDFDDAKVTEVEALAAVPYEGFKESAARTISRWTWISDDPRAGTSCRMGANNIILPLVFNLD